jgi:hypothetical protein
VKLYSWVEIIGTDITGQVNACTDNEVVITRLDKPDLPWRVPRDLVVEVEHPLVDRAANLIVEILAERDRSWSVEDTLGYRRRIVLTVLATVGHKLS